jgi:RNA polymerase sigma-70 factor (ECF subfamily)
MTSSDAVLPGSEVTILLRRLSEGDKAAESEIFRQLYSQLRRLAAAHLCKERPGHTLQATALVNETYFKLTQGERSWRGRLHFFALASKAMRQILADHARRRNASKRDAGGVRVPFEETLHVTAEQSELVLFVDEALKKLERLDPRQSRIVELRYFGGLTDAEIGQILNISTRTVKRDWAMARAWLSERLRP